MRPEQPAHHWLGKKMKTNFNRAPIRKVVSEAETIFLRSQDKTSKNGGFYSKKINEVSDPVLLTADLTVQ